MTKNGRREVSLLNKHIEDLSPEEMKEGKKEGIKAEEFCRVFSRKIKMSLPPLI
ncbi:hypothetical protein BASH2_pXO20001 (plasmid) [Bacillus anthracis]|nr:hypothetical protein BASH2_pXO20001 [Bacillus anthracis]